MAAVGVDDDDTASPLLPTRAASCKPDRVAENIGVTGDAVAVVADATGNADVEDIDVDA